MSKHGKSTQFKDDTARIVADITGYSIDTVQRVRRDEFNNDDVMANLIDWTQLKRQLKENLTKKQDLYWKIQKSGQWHLISEVEEAIDLIQETYQELFEDTLKKAEAKLHGEAQ